MGSAPTAIGGQAVIEGVMMRGPKGYAVSVRRASGAIQSLVLPYTALIVRYPSLNIPVVRGALSLVEMMTIGLRSLEYSANEATKDMPASTNSSNGSKAKEQGEFTRRELILTMMFSLAIGLTLFVVIPNLSTHFLGAARGGMNPFVEEREPVLYNLVSGAIRMMIIVGYIYAISLMKDVKRLFQYHGAEHKAVSAFEAGKELTVENVRPFTRLHPRCGTTFIAITLLVAIVVFAVFAKILVAIWPEFFHLHFGIRKTILIVGHILIMPVVAGVCYELLRLGGKYRNNIFLKLLITPGFWFQRLTTREPDDSMIEVAVEALKSALQIDVPQRIAEPVPAKIQPAAIPKAAAVG